MILDEPVASLDPEGERAVFALFARMAQAKVILFTTHRYDSIPERHDDRRARRRAHRRDRDA